MANPQPARARDAEPLTAVDDAELVRRAQLGSVAAFEALVVRHGARLHRYLRVELRHESDAHDALQESLTAAWRGLPGLRRADRFWPWLVGIASHKAADIHRRRGSRRRAGALAVTHDDDLLLETREALSALPAQQREVLLLRYLLGFTEEEAAARSACAWGRSSRGARGRGARCSRSCDETTSARPGAASFARCSPVSATKPVIRPRPSCAGRRDWRPAKAGCPGTPGDAYTALAPPPPTLGCGGCGDTRSLPRASPSASPPGSPRRAARGLSSKASASYPRPAGR